MKRTDRLTIIIALLLFAAFVSYVAVYVMGALSTATVTAEAVTASVTLGGVANGIIIRDETVLVSYEPYIDVTAGEGEKVAAGSAIATAVSGQQGLERVNRLHVLELEIERVSTALGEMRSAGDLTNREAAQSAAARNLASAVTRHDTAVLDSLSLRLDALLLDTGGEEVSAARLDALEREKQSLENSSVGDTEKLTAEFSGVFSSVVDGYEHLTYADVEKAAPSDIAALIGEARESPEGAYGKLVAGHRWYFAAVMSAADAENLTVGRSAALDFGRYGGSAIEGKILSVSPAEKRSVAVVFRCDTALADTLSMRAVTATVVFESYSGIRIPARAVQTDDETGDTYVWTVTAMRLERKNVAVAYETEDFAIVSRDSGPDALREGNTVVVSGTNLYEGKIME